MWLLFSFSRKISAERYCDFDCHWSAIGGMIHPSFAYYSFYRLSNSFFLKMLHFFGVENFRRISWTSYSKGSSIQDRCCSHKGRLMMQLRNVIRFIPIYNCLFLQVLLYFHLIAVLFSQSFDIGNLFNHHCMQKMWEVRMLQVYTTIRSLWVSK